MNRSPRTPIKITYLSVVQTDDFHWQIGVIYGLIALFKKAHV